MSCGKWWQVVFFRQVSTWIPSDGKKMAHTWCLLKPIFPRIQPTITGRFLNDMDSWKVRLRTSCNGWFVTFRGIRLTGRGLLAEIRAFSIFKGFVLKNIAWVSKKPIPQFSVTETNIAQSSLVVWCILKQNRRLHAERHAEPQAFPTAFFLSCASSNFPCSFEWPSKCQKHILLHCGRRERRRFFMKAGRREEQKKIVCVCARERMKINWIFILKFSNFN